MKIKFSSLGVGSVLAVIIVSIYIGYAIIKPERKLPVYQPKDLNAKLVDSTLQHKSRGHTVKDFSFTNQLGKEVSLATFDNTIFVTDFFFTTCKGICPKMTNQLQRVHESFSNNPKVKLLSHTVTPEIDSVETLLNYAEQLNVDHEKWHFVTGDKKAIYDMARTAYFACLDPSTGDDHDFVHTENFVLVDTRKRLRGFYDGTSEKEVTQLISDIRLLLADTEGK